MVPDHLNVPARGIIHPLKLSHRLIQNCSKITVLWGRWWKKESDYLSILYRICFSTAALLCLNTLNIKKVGWISALVTIWAYVRTGLYAAQLFCLLSYNNQKFRALVYNLYYSWLFYLKEVSPFTVGASVLYVVGTWKSTCWTTNLTKFALWLENQLQWSNLFWWLKKLQL